MAGDMPEAGFSATVDLNAAAAAGAAKDAQPPFSEMLPEEYRASKWAENFSKSANPLHELAKGYENAQQQIGKLSSRVEVPGEGATPEQVAAYRKATGVPDSVAGYVYQAPDLSKEPEAVQNLWKMNSNEQLAKDGAAKAHELGMTPKQYEGMHQLLDQHNIAVARALTTAAEQAQQQNQQAEMESFKKVFGDKADTVRNLAKETLTKIGLPAEFANRPDAALIFAMDYIHKNMFTDDKIASDPAAGGMADEAAIRKEIDAIQSNPTYRQKYPVEQFNALHQKAIGLYTQLAEMGE